MMPSVPTKPYTRKGTLWAKYIATNPSTIKLKRSNKKASAVPPLFWYAKDPPALYTASNETMERKKTTSQIRASPFKYVDQLRIIDFGRPI